LVSSTPGLQLNHDFKFASTLQEEQANDTENDGAIAYALSQHPELITEDGRKIRETQLLEIINNNGDNGDNGDDQSFSPFTPEQFIKDVSRAYGHSTENIIEAIHYVGNNPVLVRQYLKGLLDDLISKTSAKKKAEE
jgi:hypothetical protein